MNAESLAIDLLARFGRFVRCADISIEEQRTLLQYTTARCAALIDEDVIDLADIISRISDDVR